MRLGKLSDGFQELDALERAMSLVISSEYLRVLDPADCAPPPIQMFRDLPPHRRLGRSTVIVT
jgi:hypothetical protein